jgi:TatA/E family protein of Tat protein translocase
VQLGPAEILVVLVIALLVFGPNKLPEVGRQVGRAMKEFRQFQQTMTRDVHEVFTDATGSAEPPPSLPPKPAASPEPNPETSGVIDAQSTDVSRSETSRFETSRFETSVSELPVSGLTAPDARAVDGGAPDAPDSGGDPEAST